MAKTAISFLSVMAK